MRDHEVALAHLHQDGVGLLDVHGKHAVALARELHARNVAVIFFDERERGPNADREPGRAARRGSAGQLRCGATPGFAAVAGAPCSYRAGRDRRGAGRGAGRGLVLTRRRRRAANAANVAELREARG